AVEEVARLLQAPDLRRDYPDATLAGCLLRASGAIPEEGQGMDWRQWRFEVERRIGPRIERVRATRRVEAPAGSALAVVHRDGFLGQAAQARVHAPSGAHDQREQDFARTRGILDADLDAVEMAAH